MGWSGCCRDCSVGFVGTLAEALIHGCMGWSGWSGWWGWWGWGNLKQEGPLPVQQKATKRGLIRKGKAWNEHGGRYCLSRCFAPVCFGLAFRTLWFGMNMVVLFVLLSIEGIAIVLSVWVHVTARCFAPVWDGLAFGGGHPCLESSFVFPAFDRKGSWKVLRPLFWFSIPCCFTRAWMNMV